LVRDDAVGAAGLGNVKDPGQLWLVQRGRVLTFQWSWGSFGAEDETRVGCLGPWARRGRLCRGEWAFDGFLPRSRSWALQMRGAEVLLMGVR